MAHLICVLLAAARFKPIQYIDVSTRLKFTKKFQTQINGKMYARAKRENKFNNESRSRCGRNIQFEYASTYSAFCVFGNLVGFFFFLTIHVIPWSRYPSTCVGTCVKRFAAVSKFRFNRIPP